MFDIFEMLNLGKKFEAHGKEWIVIKSLGVNQMVLAVEANQELPCQVYFLQMPIEPGKEKA